MGSIASVEARGMLRGILNLAMTTLECMASTTGTTTVVVMSTEIHLPSPPQDEHQGIQQHRCLRQRALNAIWMVRSVNLAMSLRTRADWPKFRSMITCLREEMHYPNSRKWSVQELRLATRMRQSYRRLPREGHVDICDGGRRVGCAIVQAAAIDDAFAHWACGLKIT